MNKEQQRIAIAEVCGAKWYQWAGEYWITFKDWSVKSHCYEADRPAETSNHPKIEVSVPDYLNDLNAMHEAEKVLTRDKRTQLVNVLLCVVIKDLDRNTPMLDKLRVLYYATAAQRAEAFLRTLNLWTNDA